MVSNETKQQAQTIHTIYLDSTYFNSQHRHLRAIFLSTQCNLPVVFCCTEANSSVKLLQIETTDIEKAISCVHNFHFVKPKPMNHR